MPYQIYIVEDHPVMREAYAAVLTAQPDFEVCGMAASAEEAAAALGAVQCDLVLTDLRLPGQSGVEFVRALQSSRPGLPAIVITAHEDEAFAREARDAGASAFLWKRDLHQKLVGTIHEVLDGRASDGSAEQAPS